MPFEIKRIQTTQNGHNIQEKLTSGVYGLKRTLNMYGISVLTTSITKYPSLLLHMEYFVLGESINNS